MPYQGILKFISGQSTGAPVQINLEMYNIDSNNIDTDRLASSEPNDQGIQWLKLNTIIS